MKLLLLLCFLIFVGTFFSFMLGHEFGHVFFNDFRWTGRACFLNCGELESENYKFNSNQTPITGVELIAPFNELAVDEGACDLVGYGFAGLFLVSGLFVLTKVF